MSLESEPKFYMRIILYIIYNDYICIVILII
nr:MAG TPA: hypothetical protein [Caudoviricetes sp.]DAY58468.1 MAG TPA: hypothetical protein [Caudoviricetes sp.]